MPAAAAAAAAAAAGSAAAAPASALFLLEAKSFAEEDRSAAASSVQYWLKPGAYSVGKPRHSELAIDEDKSISRKHADLEVPAADAREPGSEPYVLLTDRSKYGSVLSRSGTFADEERPEGGAAARVPAGCMLRFGFKSPFKLYHQDWALYLGPQQREAAAPGEVAALEAAAAATGLPLTDELPGCPGTRVLALGGAPLRIDGPLLLGLLRGHPVVGSGWLLEWQQQKVWCNARPQEAAYPVQLQYADGSGSGRLKALPGPAALLAARDAAPLAGRTLLWLPPARDAGLQAAAEALGATSHDVAAAGRAPAAAKAAGAVLVRGRADDAVPAAYRRLPWTTPELLIAGMLENRVEAALHEPADGGADTTPPSAGRGRRARGNAAAAATAGTGAGKKGRARGKAAAAAAAAAEAGHESGSETDASEGGSPQARGATQRTLALAPAQQQQQAAAAEEEVVVSEPDDLPAPTGRRGKQAAAAAAAAPAAAPAPSGAKAGGRKRRQPEAEEEEQQEQQQQPAAEAPTPAKKARRQAPAPAAADGWQIKGSGRKPEQEEVADGDAGPGGRTPAAGGTAAPSAAAASAAKPSAAPAARAAAPAPAVGHEESASGEEAELEEGEEYEEDEEGNGNATVQYCRMVMAPLPPPANGAAANGAAADTGPNFKAFRRGGAGGGGGGGGDGAVFPLIPLASDPYFESGGQVDTDAFLRAEAEKRRQRLQADELFSANLKARCRAAKKAAQLPDPDDDSPPSKGRGRGKKAAAPAAGQKSILGFLPPAGPGRGRGRGRGAGRGKK